MSESKRKPRRATKHRDRPDWREFEELASTIEGVLSPKGAEVKSPDKVPDLITGKMREVDASIRYKVGSVPVLITIECRRRGRTEDDTWIEQLAKKRDKIGAAKTIAVSARGFSSSARITAGLSGIELRVISDIKRDEILTWCDLEFLHFSPPPFAITSIVLIDDAGHALDTSDIPDEVAVAVKSGGGRAAILECAEGMVTVDDIIQSWQNQFAGTPQDLLYGVELDGAAIGRVIRANLEKQKYWLAGVSNRSVAAVQLGLRVKKTLLAIPARRTYRYSDTGEVIAEGKEFFVPQFDPISKRDATIVLQNSSSGGIMMRVKLEDGPASS